MKILLVEDNELNRDMLSRRLIKRGFSVVTAINGQEGIDKAIDEKPNLILMDLSLPIINGWDATREIKSNKITANIPIIALTASAGDDSREDCLSAGCTDHISKPIQSIELFEILSKYIKKVN